MKRSRLVVVLLGVVGIALALPSKGLAGGNYSLDEVPGFAAAQADPGQGGGSVLEERDQAQKTLAHSRWAILPHRPNYLMPYTYNTSPNNAPFKAADPNAPDVDEAEAKFQISFKLPLWEGMFGSGADLFFAYTQISLWQVYNDSSAPFRDTNYEPEAVVVVRPGLELLGLTNRVLAFGLVHQSNGRGNSSLSRSWNRVYVAAEFDRGNFACSIKPWWRIPEDKKEPGSFEGDDNPNIERYYGYGEFRAGYRWGRNVFAMMLRNNLRAPDNKGAIELDWSFPLYAKLKGYVQFFNGYGESLIDYDHANQRIGVGVLLSDWL